MLVPGDVNSTLAASLVAVKLGVPVGHIEAGLRSFDWSMPEEINRVVTDRVASLLFTHSPEAQDNLRTDRIVVCLVIYALLGLISDLIVRVLERVLLTWRQGLEAS